MAVFCCEMFDVQIGAQRSVASQAERLNVSLTKGLLPV